MCSLPPTTVKQEWSTYFAGRSRLCFRLVIIHVDSVHNKTLSSIDPYREQGCPSTLFVLSGMHALEKMEYILADRGRAVFDSEFNDRYRRRYGLSAA